MKAVVCPVCNGSGKYNNGECHGCKGIDGKSKGWVEVKEDSYQNPIYPYYPYAPWYPSTNPFYPYTVTFTGTL